MKMIIPNINYQKTLTIWAGCNVELYDDFDLICQSDFDFIEILMLFEKEYFLDLLDTTKVRQDFNKVDDFISWAVSQPHIEKNFVFSLSYKPKILSIPELSDQERALQLQA